MRLDHCGRAGRWLALTAGLAAAAAALAGDVGITYVKTLGQVCPELPLVTGGGRMSVDEKGFLYAGTPGQNSFLQKIAPDGRVIWRADDTHCAYTGTAVDDAFVYGCGVGYYGNRHLLRRKRASGVLAPGWRYMWGKPDEVLNGVRSFTAPGALLVDAVWLYVLDTGAGELRRVNKATGEEKPFPAPIKVEGAVDMAFSSAGTLLVLAKDAVQEFDRATGKPLRPRVLAGLRGPTAIAVQPRTGVIYIAEGGTPEKPVNQVRLFSAAGEFTGATVGRGGEWQGKWSPDALGFATGGGDVALDGAGGFWANAWGHRADRLALITHVDAAGKADKTFLGALAEGVAADGELSAYAGGNYKIGWDGALRWTSGLAATGKPGLFPTTLGGWGMRAVYADARRAIFLMVHHCKLVAVDPATGISLEKEAPVPGPSLVGACVAGGNVFVTNGAAIYRTTLDLAPPQLVIQVPDDIKAKGVTGLAVDADGKLLYLSAGSGDAARVYALGGNNARAWEAKAGQLFTRYRGVLLAANPAGPGFLALNAADGALAGLFGQKALDDRPPLWNIAGMGVGSRDGADYLFVAAQYRLLVYRIAAGE